MEIRVDMSNARQNIRDMCIKLDDDDEQYLYVERKEQLFTGAGAAKKTKGSVRRFIDSGLE